MRITGPCCIEDRRNGKKYIDYGYNWHRDKNYFIYHGRGTVEELKKTYPDAIDLTI